EFLAILQAPDPMGAYHEYLDQNRAVLTAYWKNYVLDLDSPHVEDIVARTVKANRTDLRLLLQTVDIEALARETAARCVEVFEADIDFDVYVMVGVGAANAGELVVDGKGVAFVCLEHFTGRSNPETYGLGLHPDLIPLWLAHEIAHTVRYTSPTTKSDMARIVAEANGNYDYWDSGSRATLLELVVNEGLAVMGSQAVVPDRDACDYLGYGRRQYNRLRELEAFLRNVMAADFDRTGLGYRLRYLSGGMSPAARLVGGRVIPERAGYYLGASLVESIVAERGIAAALRATAEECLEADANAAEIQTA
ncbi:MAG: DUF2268 domain-containing putative Zn-dependent protease, partial [Gemmatimonadales bacterium]